MELQTVPIRMRRVQRKVLNIENRRDTYRQQQYQQRKTTKRLMKTATKTKSTDDK